VSIDERALSRADELIESAEWQLGKDRYASNIPAQQEMTSVVRGLGYAVLALVALQRGQYAPSESGTDEGSADGDSARVLANSDGSDSRFAA
jgi:hypothetical protein